MDPQLITIIIAMAGAVGSVFAFVAGRKERAASAESQKGSAAAQISEGYMNLVNSLEERVRCLEVDKDDMVSEMKAMRTENMELRQDMRIMEREKIRLTNRVIELETEVVRLEDALTNGNGNR